MQWRSCILAHPHVLQASLRTPAHPHARTAYHFHAGKKTTKKLKKERNQLKQQLKNTTGKAAKKIKKKLAEVNAKLTKAGGA